MFDDERSVLTFSSFSTRVGLIVGSSEWTGDDGSFVLLFNCWTSISALRLRSSCLSRRTLSRTKSLTRSRRCSCLRIFSRNSGEGGRGPMNSSWSFCLSEEPHGFKFCPSHGNSLVLTWRHGIRIIVGIEFTAGCGCQRFFGICLQH